MIRTISSENLAKLACALSGVAWGLFWIPLRWLQQAGIEGPWIGAVFFLLQTACLMPLIVFRIDRLKAGGSSLMITGIFAGGALALYALAVVYTDVIRAMLLFYLTPVWSTLLARMILREPITGLRWLAIAMALAGMLVIFGIDIGVPWPRNFGDWLGLASGVLWAIAAVRLNLDRSNDPIELTFVFFVWATITCVAVVMLPNVGPSSIPALGDIAGTLPWLLPMLALIVVPGAYAAMWGARLVDPGIVGILFMTEIIVGTITVAIWAGEPFGAREVTGITLITTAGLLESVWNAIRRPVRA